MRQFIDYVVVEQKNGKRYLFTAPAHSYLKAGTIVTVDTVNGPELGTVVASTTEYTDTTADDVKFLIDAFGATLPLRRILSKRVEYELDYSDYEEVENYEQTESEKTE